VEVPAKKKENEEKEGTVFLMPQRSSTIGTKKETSANKNECSDPKQKCGR
jgi:hypothetical protein